jgi:hypothetical protein
MWYLAHVMSAEDKTLLSLMPARNDPVRACHLTCAALAWVLCGHDLFPPYSNDDKWESADEGWGQGVRIVAGSKYPDRAGFDADHVALVVGDTVFDSWWLKRELGEHTAHNAQSSTSFSDYKRWHHQRIHVEETELEQRVDLLVQIFSGSLTGEESDE